MKNPGDILDALVAHAREIPELVAEVRQDPARIYGWKDAYPGGDENGAGVVVSGSSVQDAIANQPEDSVMFAVSGPLRAGPGDGAWYEHRFSVICFPGTEDAAGKVYRMIAALMNGTVASLAGQRWLFACHFDSTEPIQKVEWNRAAVQRASDGIQVWLGRFAVMDQEP